MMNHKIIRRIAENIGLLLFCLLLNTALFGQYSPNALSYQAVARNSTGSVLVNEDLTVHFSILANNPNGDLVWKEEHQVKTNKFGLFTLNIGTGIKKAGTANDLASIQWGNGPHFLRVEINFGGSNFLHMGTTQMFAVPYAMYAEKAGNAEPDFANFSYDDNTGKLVNNGTAVADLTPLKQSLQYDAASSHLTISGMPGVIDLREFKHPPQDLRIAEDKIWLTGNTDYTEVDLRPYKQTLTLTTGSKLAISGGNSVSVDTSAANEIQTLSKSGNKIILSNGGEASVDDADADPENELITSLNFNKITQEITINEGTNNSKKVNIKPKQVAFRYLKHINNSLNPGDKYVVKFLIKEYDELDVYDINTGIFTVPSEGEGVYCFFVNFLNLSNEFTVELYVNDINPRPILSYNQPLMIKLYANDKVKIQVTSNASDLTVLNKGSFIGYKLN